DVTTEKPTHNHRLRSTKPAISEEALEISTRFQGIASGPNRSKVGTASSTAVWSIRVSCLSKTSSAVLSRSASQSPVRMPWHIAAVTHSHPGRDLSGRIARDCEGTVEL